MRFYTKQHRYYCGIDLHARSMYVCILDPQGEILFHRNMPCAPELFLKSASPLPRRHGGCRGVHLHLVLACRSV
jgi:hypothetical protein